MGSEIRVWSVWGQRICPSDGIRRRTTLVVSEAEMVCACESARSLIPQYALRRQGGWVASNQTSGRGVRW